MKKKRGLIILLLVSILLSGSGVFFGNNEVYAAKTADDVVIVLDPGHDGTHAGASHYGYKEHELVYKIASYCKEELEKYDGVKVYMTRTTNACPYSGTSTSDCMKKRAEYAKNVDADVFISFHLNASENGSIHGASVYYPNNNYYPTFGTEGKKLATNILTELTNLGISQWGQGLYIRNSENNTRYPDGSLADYLGVIRNAKMHGIPAVLIEHAFLSNHSDVTTYLNSDEKLQKIGIADATAIAQYYGLTEGEEGDSEDSSDDTSEETLPERTLVKKEDGKWYCITNGGLDHYTGVVPYYGSLYYVYDGVLDWNYTGLAENEEGLWYVNKGKVDVTKFGLVYHNGTWYNVREGYVDTSYSNLVSYNGTLYYVKNGIIDWTYSDIVPYKNQWYYIKNATINWNYTGLAHGYTGWWYIKNGKVDFTKNGLVQYNGTWYNVVDGYLDWSYNGLVKYNGTLYYVKNGSIDWKYSGIAEYGKKSYYIKNATINWNYTGLAQGSTGWWYIKNGKVDTTKNGLVYYNGTWYNVVDGYLDWSYSGLVEYNGTLYYVYKGSINWNSSNIVQYNDESYYIKNATIAWNYTGLAKGDSGWWYVKNGKVDTTKNGLVYYNGNWYNVVDGYLDWSYSSLVKYNGTWYYVKNGQIDWKYTDVVSYNGKRFYVRNGSIDWNYTGIAGNSERKWYVRKGIVDTTYNGVITQDGVTYTVIEGQALENGTAIMGNSSVTVDQMVAYYNARATYPAYYATSDAPDIRTFCQIYLEECAAEGVKAEVAFGQAMLETGFLRYGGQVDISQYNFAGLGAVDGGTSGASFSDVRTGIRAQVQHLKAYACDDSLNNACVDPRFKYVTRGCAPYVEWLGIQENPYGKGWASEEKYGFTIRNNYIEKLLNT